jgi:hypothetical protein
LEEAEAKYIETLRKARPDLAEQVNYVQEKESRPPRKEWRLKSTKADKKVSADAHMVFASCRVPCEAPGRAVGGPT